MTATEPRVTHPSKAFRDGLRDMTGIAIGYIPFAIAIGVATADSSIDNLAGWAGGFVIAAGSAHLAVVQMVDSGAGPVAIIATSILINARLAVYSAGLVPWFAHESARSRRLLAYFVIDPTYILVVNRFERDDPGPKDRRSYYLGAGWVLLTIWTVALGSGVLLGSRIPAAIQVDAAAPMIVCGLLAASVRSRTGGIAAGVAAFLAVAAADLPWSSATLLAILAGSAAGTMGHGSDS
jgi:predicted branched-subunit amino acid permease